MTALLAELGSHVYSVEIVPTLCNMAKINLQVHDISNVTLEEGDAAQGWPQHGPYDVIVLTGSTPGATHVISIASIRGSSPTIANKRPPGLRLF